MTAGLERLGWTDHARIHRPAADVTLVIIDAPLDRDVTIELEGPTTFSLSIFLEGSGTLSVRGLPPVEISPGMAVLFASGGHSSGVNTLRGGHQFRVVDMRFEESFLIRSAGAELGPSGTSLMQAAEVGSSGVFLAGFSASREMIRLAGEIADATGSATLAERLVLQGKAIAVLGAAFDALDRTTESVRLRPQDRIKIERARTLIEQRYNEDWTIARLAREIGLGEKLLKHAFRAVVGRPVHAHLTSVRLEAAGRELAGGKSVTDAALAVGFTNLSHFSKVFRAAKGVSPSRYARHR